MFSFDVTAPQNSSHGIVFIKADVRNAAQLQRGFQKIGGTVDLLVNNAGIMRRGKIFESSEKDWDDLFAVNAKGYWLVTKTAQKFLKPRAQILFMSSMHGLSLPEDPALYGITKRMIISLAEVVALTYPRYRIKIVAPGPVDTAMSKAGRTKAEFEKRNREIQQIKPEVFCKKILALIESDHTELFYNSRASSYSYR